MADMVLKADVAPRAGAWIETEMSLRPISAVGVAPRAGARIETWSAGITTARPWSPPARGRGLKLRWDGHSMKEDPSRPPRGGVD